MSLILSINGERSPFNVRFSPFGAPEAVAVQQLVAVEALRAAGVRSFERSHIYPGAIYAEADALAVQGILDAAVDTRVVDNRPKPPVVDTAVL